MRGHCGWRDVTRDVAHEPRPTQFRIDLRSLAQVMEARLPGRVATIPTTMMIGGLGLSFRVWELFVVTLALQVGMMPLLASQFHRITFAGPFVNCGGAVDSGDCATGIFYHDPRVVVSGGGQGSGAAAFVGGVGDVARGAAFRRRSEVQLPDT